MMVHAAIAALIAGSLVSCANGSHVFDHTTHTLDKKFDIIAKPKAPDYLTVLLKGKDGRTGPPGAQGDAGPPGDQGPPGPTGDKGIPGSCSRTQCEDEKLKELIQRLLALEKYVASRNNNGSSNNNTNNNNNNNKNKGNSVGNKKPSIASLGIKACNNNPLIIIPMLPLCSDITSITIVPIPLPKQRKRKKTGKGRTPQGAKAVNQNPGTANQNLGPDNQTPKPANQNPGPDNQNLSVRPTQLPPPPPLPTSATPTGTTPSVSPATYSSPTPVTIQGSTFTFDDNAFLSLLTPPPPQASMSSPYGGSDTSFQLPNYANGKAQVRGLPLNNQEAKNQNLIKKNKIPLTLNKFHQKKRKVHKKTKTHHAHKQSHTSIKPFERH
ncbi:predicted protein [Nematostella vectensis]|uniref:Uncharacterized protein n=1 Tax=Nematostella vectensis TaxID=45351 RepID=A7RLU8_NEMVE|nr:predicted protein [Nematostella vectensis]|eukprot:XP_001639457.1 predicted protein [Nematostella vectensis]